MGQIITTTTTTTVPTTTPTAQLHRTTRKGEGEERAPSIWHCYRDMVFQRHRPTHKERRTERPYLLISSNVHSLHFDGDKYYWVLG